MASTFVRMPKKPVYGRYKILQRTDGMFVVFDREAPLGEGTVHLAKTEVEVREVAARLSGLTQGEEDGD
jgi:hypothetical protein